jgi:hypothetical protein
MAHTLFLWGTASFVALSVSPLQSLTDPELTPFLTFHRTRQLTQASCLHLRSSVKRKSLPLNLNM